MTSEKRAFDKQQKPAKPLLESFSILFYICKFVGINSQDFKEFKKYKQLKKSPGGDIIAIFFIIAIVVNFNIMVIVFENTTYKDEKDNLAVAIGYVLTYFSLFTYLADRITALLSQQSFKDIFQDLTELDEDFLDIDIVIDNNSIKYSMIWVMCVAALMEALIFIFTFTFLVDQSSYSAWLWMFTSMPTFFNSLDKLWYTSILKAIRKRFVALNEALNDIAAKLQMEYDNEKDKNSKECDLKNGLAKKISKKNKIYPVTTNFNEIFGDEVKNPQMFPNAVTTTTSFKCLEERLVKLCQLHDGLCNVGKLLNDLWAFPNLVLMGYGFFIITAQLYFLYCSNANQVIPSLFRPARNLGITAIYLTYVYAKCMGILYFNWVTNLECKKTGICLHRCAVAADKDEIYEMTNHLSLKLFNHLLDFNACGYFPLNMRTLFSFCGGITTYLIILIQFNIEEQQVKANNAN